MGDGGVRTVCSMSVSPAWYIGAGAPGAGPAGVPTTERRGTQAGNRPRRHADRAVTRRLELVLGPASIRPPLVATPPPCRGHCGAEKQRALSQHGGEGTGSADALAAGSRGKPVRQAPSPLSSFGTAGRRGVALSPWA